MKTVTYKGATYTYQPRLNEIVVDTPRNGQLRFALPPVKLVASVWSDTAEPLKTFWRSIYGSNTLPN